MNPFESRSLVEWFLQNFEWMALLVGAGILGWLFYATRDAARERDELYRQSRSSSADKPDSSDQSN